MFPFCFNHSFATIANNCLKNQNLPPFWSPKTVPTWTTTLTHFTDFFSIKLNRRINRKHLSYSFYRILRNLQQIFNFFYTRRPFSFSSMNYLYRNNIFHFLLTIIIFGYYLQLFTAPSSLNHLYISTYPVRRIGCVVACSGSLLDGIINLWLRELC